ncbi:hypothetical protein N7530_002377 [Penicillium desertorum]|uniref:HNH nuclease domain-containing protein n=1 Tax=Penicillium desertorum TaxID=1303715 RepID=A0A9X0BT61_9EURO|nr:hypothetical protein N7530_002377 [Penicillium desertorum]
MLSILLLHSYNELRSAQSSLEGVLDFIISRTPQAKPMSLSSPKSATPTGTRRRVSVLRQKCLIRDCHRCEVSQIFDRAAARMRGEEDAESCADDDGNMLKDEPTDQFQYLEVAHIIRINARNRIPSI